MEASNTTKSSTPEEYILKLLHNYFDDESKKYNYEYVHFTLLSILEVCQKLLFLQEVTLQNDTKVHISNLLDIAKEMVQKDQFELLDKLKECLILNNNEV